MNPLPNPHSLLDVDDSLLIVIDIQDAFLEKLPLGESERLLNNACWLIRLARWCAVPLVVTAEEASILPVAQRITQVIPPGTTVFDKWIFGLAQQPDILAEVTQTSRKTAVLIGLETDVCVAHSALGLLDKGYRVATVTDATDSPAPGHEMGLKRMAAAGVILLNMKGLFYEWLRTVEAISRFHRELPDMRAQAGIIL